MQSPQLYSVALSRTFPSAACSSVLQVKYLLFRGRLNDGLSSSLYKSVNKLELRNRYLHLINDNLSLPLIKWRTYRTVSSTWLI